MFALRFGLIALIALAQPPLLGHAQTDRVGARQLKHDKTGRFAMFRSKPARELMLEDEFAQYGKALEEFDCDRANDILNKAFVREYPNFKEAELGPYCPEADSCYEWSSYAKLEFKEFEFCTVTVKLKYEEADIRRQNLPLTKFKMDEYPPTRVEYRHNEIKLRDYSASSIINIARGGYRPALLELAQLIRMGELFNAGDDVEYYVLKRACLVGDDCSDVANRLGELRTVIGGERAAAIDTMAEAEQDDRPSLHQLLLGQPF